MPALMNNTRAAALCLEGRSAAAVYKDGKCVFRKRRKYMRLTPAMTGNTTPAPFVASASTVYDNSMTNYGPFTVFDQIQHVSTQRVGWVSGREVFTGPDNTGNEWIQIDLGASKTLVNYILRSRGYSPVAADYNQFPRDFTLSVSKDGINFTDIETRTNIPQPTAWWQPCEFTLNTGVAGRFFRWTVTRTGVTTQKLVCIGEIEPYGF